METQRVAVFVDLENISAAYIEPVADLADTCGRVCHLAVYADWRQSQNRAAWTTTLDLGGVPKQIMKAGGANSADISIVVDAMELLLRAEIDVFVLATGDSDFVPLVQKLRERGKLVVGAAPAAKVVRAIYESAFDRFERLHESVEEAPAPPPKAKPSQTSTRTNAPTPLTLGTTRRAILGILQREVTMTVGDLGNLMRDAVPGFSAKALGFRRLSDLLRAQSDLIAVANDGNELRVSLNSAPIVRTPKPVPPPPVPAPPPREAPVANAAPSPPPVPAEPLKPPPPLERADWTRMRDHLLAVLLAPDAKPHASDEEILLGIEAIAKRTAGGQLPAMSVQDIAGHYPSCFARNDDGTIAPVVNLVDAYKLRLARLWEPMPRAAMRRGLALLPSIVGADPVRLADVTDKLAEVANGDLSHAEARSVVNLVRKADGWAPAPADDQGRQVYRARDWLRDPAAAEGKIDACALDRMGPFAPVDPAAMAAALGVEAATPPPVTEPQLLPLEAVGREAAPLEPSGRENPPASGAIAVVPSAKGDAPARAAEVPYELPTIFQFGPAERDP